MSGLTPRDAVVLAWWIFLAYWAITSLRVKRTVENEKLLSRLPHVAIMVGAFTLLFWDELPLGWLDGRFVPRELAVRWAGVALTCLGVALAIWARNHIGRNWSSKVTLKEDHELIRSGPYAKVRHPIYSGVLLGAAGTALVQGKWRDILGIGLIFLAHSFKAHKEEALMTRQFGSEYDEYRKQTGALIPRL
jgi:protein-S-isoprenylcysteine O-methyltransferase Ste14